MSKRKNRINKLWRISVTILSTLVIFLIIVRINTAIGQTFTSEENMSGQLVTTTYNKDLSLDKDYIADNIKSIIDKYSVSDKIAISFTDLSTDTYISFNDSKEFLGASTTKLPLALFICDKLEKGEISLEDTIAYSTEDYEEGAGIMLDSFDGQPYTIETLLENMLVHSDNIATNMFYTHFGYSETKEAIGDLVGVDINTNENIITSKQMNKFLKFLYSKRNKPYYKDVISLLSNTTFHDRLDKYLPCDIVAHKIGNYNGNTHDVGIVFSDKPYVLSVYTDNIENSEELIASLSKEIYDFYCTL